MHVKLGQTFVTSMHPMKSPTWFNVTAGSITVVSRLQRWIPMCGLSNLASSASTCLRWTLPMKRGNKRLQATSPTGFQTCMTTYSLWLRTMTSLSMSSSRRSGILGTVNLSRRKQQGDWKMERLGNKKRPLSKSILWLILIVMAVIQIFPLISWIPATPN